MVVASSYTSIGPPITVSCGGIINPCSSPHLAQSPIAGGISNTCNIEYVSAGVTYPCSTAPAKFSTVSKGDVIVVALDTYADLLQHTTNGWNSVTITDSLGSSYTQAIGKCSSQFPSSWKTSYDPNKCSAIYYATVPSTGMDTVTVVLNSAPQKPSNDIVFDFYMFDVKGITTTGACIASGSGYSSSMTTTTSCPTSDYFLIATFGLGHTDTPTNCPGSPPYCGGFTLSFPGNQFNFSIYSTSGVNTPTYFPATIPTPDNWIEVAAAFTC